MNVMNESGRNPDHDRAPPEPQRFETTRWTMVLSAKGGDTSARDALATLCATYWYPLYAFVRRKGYNQEAAQDLVQGSFS